MRPADRLLEILNLLRSRRTLTAQALASELGVSVRTIYRDIEDLRGTGVPIAGEAGVGYRVEAGFELPPLTFDADELAALVAGARMIFRFGDPDLAAAARRALHKVEAALPASLRDQVQRTAIFVPSVERDDIQPIAPIQPGPSWLADLRRAIHQGRKVHLEYVRGDGGWAQRVVRPVGIFFWGRAWSVGGWCELRQEWRNFRADRVRDLAILDEGWSPEDGQTIEAFLAAMRGPDPDGKERGR